MGTTIADLYEHEGYAARKLPDGTLTSTWADTGEFVAFVPACACAGSDSRWDSWYGSTEYPPTDDGEEAALDEWERVHARPLLGDREPAGLDDEVTVLLDRLRLLAMERPVGMLAVLRRIERTTDEVLAEAVANARQAGKSWSEVGRPMGMSKQAAQQRWGR